MPGIQDLSLFVVAGLLLNMAPGPDSLLVITRSATQGWRAGSAAALGIGAGTLVHIAASALGLSAILATSATAFAVVKYAGAAYLVYVGIALMLAQEKASTAAVSAAPVHAGLWRIFAQGFLTNVLNPKVAIFFLAFVPQFIAIDAPNKALAFVVLGCVFNFNGMLWLHVLVASSSFASRRLQASAAVKRWLNRAVGAMFLSFGVKLALSERS